MALSITNLNIDPNRVWFARLAADGGNISVDLYLTYNSAEAQAGRQAHGNTSGFGSDLPVTLVADSGASVPPTLFQSTYAWHLRVSGQDGDAAQIFKVKEFVDLDEISHPLYRNELLIPMRATAEIDAHTHAAIKRDLDLGLHLPTLDVGQIARITSARLAADVLGQVTEHRIAGEPNQLTSSCQIASYLALKR